MENVNMLRNESTTAQKHMNACDDRVSKYQSEWMKLQDQLIRASETMEKENAAINALLSAQTELEQRKLRLQSKRFFFFFKIRMIATAFAFR
jgi:hypothetical protein